MFHCRQTELSKLNQRYHQHKFECVIIYGRRRVGKTAIINEFTKDKPTIYFSALNSSSQKNLAELSRAIFYYTTPSLSAAPTYNSYADALDAITKLAEQQQFVLVIDEYPYLVAAEDSISSRLQHIIDHKWCNTSIFLILCGSSMSFMEKQVLGYESPLYGRRTAQFKIEPLTYRETAEFNPDLSNEENAIIYGITGGIPHYINKLNPGNGIDAALLNNLFDRSAYLYEEPENLLKQELREPAMYNSIITVIANGASKLSEIASQAGIETAVCTKYVKVLMELGILGKETPITDNSSRKTLYFIKDTFFCFWYRFIPINYAAIHSGKISRLYEHTVKNKLHEYMGVVFERMCMDYLMRYADDLPVPLMNTGHWWGTDHKKRKQVEIDIVGQPLPGINTYIIGSCKFRNEKIGIKELTLLKEYAAVFGKGRDYIYYIFSLSGFTDELLCAQENGDVHLVTLDDMYVIQMCEINSID